MTYPYMTAMTHARLTYVDARRSCQKKKKSYLVMRAGHSYVMTHVNIDGTHMSCLMSTYMALICGHSNESCHMRCLMSHEMPHVNIHDACRRTRLIYIDARSVNIYVAGLMHVGARSSSPVSCLIMRAAFLCVMTHVLSLM